MTDITQMWYRVCRDVEDREERFCNTGPKDFPMSLLIALIVVIGLGSATRAVRGLKPISTHTYNNRYNDATAARDDHVG